MVQARRLSEKEREYAKNIFQGHSKLINVIMNAFRVWGGLQILITVIYVVSGEAPKKDIPFMIIGIVILYLAYFKLTGFLMNKNQWKTLLRAIQNRKESVYECTLINTYKTQHGDSGGAKSFMATVDLEGEVIRTNAAASLSEKEPGAKVLLIYSGEKQKSSFSFVMAQMDDLL